MRKLFYRFWLWIMPDRAAKAIKIQIAETRRRHGPTRNLEAALTALRHDQLRKAVG